MTKDYYIENGKSKGKCQDCDKEGVEMSAPNKKGKSYPQNRFYRMFRKTGWFRGDDEYLGKICKDCFKVKMQSIKDNRG